MIKKTENKLIANSCLFISGVGGLLGFLYQQALYLALPTMAIAIYLSRLQKEKTQDQIEKIQEDLSFLEQKFNKNVDQVEESLQSLPNNMISYYTERLAPLISQLQSQQKGNQELINTLQKDFRENWQLMTELGQKIDEIDDNFQNRSEIQDLQKIKEVIANIYNKFLKYVTDSTFKEELMNLTQSINNLKNQVDVISKELEKDFITESDLLFIDFVKSDELKQVEAKLIQQFNSYLTNQEFKEYHDQILSLVAKKNQNLATQKMMEELESDLARLQLSIDNFVTIDTLSEIMDDFLSKDDIEDLKNQINELSEKFNKNENLSVLSKIKTILDRLVKQEDLEYLQEQFQVLQHKFNHRPEIILIQKLQEKLEPIIDHNFSSNFGDNQANNSPLEENKLDQTPQFLDLESLNLEEIKSIYPSLIEVNSQNINSISGKNIEKQITFLTNQVNHILALQSEENNNKINNPLLSDDYNLINQHLQDLQSQITVLNESFKNLPSNDQIHGLIRVLSQIDFNNNQFELEQFNLEYMAIIKNLIRAIETSIDLFVTSDQLELIVENLNLLTQQINQLPCVDHIHDLIIALKATATKEELNIVKQDFTSQIKDCVKWQDLTPDHMIKINDQNKPTTTIIDNF